MIRKVASDDPKRGLSFLYNTKLGRIILKPLVSNKLLSTIVGRILDSKLSCLIIKPFIRKNKIKLDDFEPKKYCSFNDFFIRKIKPEKRKIIKDKNAFISPCDSKLMVYNINDETMFKVKNTVYNVSSLIKDDVLASEYMNGYALVYRLSPEDYHRYCFVDDGEVTKNYKISGKFHTVNPIVYDKFEVFKENTRECTLLKTMNFDQLIYVEVGALLVGKINNHDVFKFKKGEEKGYFMYGGSTIIILIKNNIVKIDSDILENSKNGYETYVRIGEKIGEKI